MKITNKLIANLKPSQRMHENYLKYYKGKSFTLAEFLNLEHLSVKDKLWVFTREIPGLEQIQREFALVCASRAVENCDIDEVKEFFTLVIFIVQNELWDLKDESGYVYAYLAAHRAADWDADWTADWTAYLAAYWAADRTAYLAAHRAADLDADWAAHWAAHWAAEMAVQLEIAKSLAYEFGQ